MQRKFLSLIRPANYLINKMNEWSLICTNWFRSFDFGVKLACTYFRTSEVSLEKK